jgi:hypothetical protein
LGRNLIMAASLPPFDFSKVATAISASAEVGVRMGYNKTSEVCLIIETGQSNAESVADMGATPLPTMSNVKGLARASNLSITQSDVTWDTFAAGDTFSLGRPSYGTGKTSIVTEFARNWQYHITAGNALGLPDLYVVRVPWSGQGIGLNSDSANARWNVLGANTAALTVENLAYFTQFIVQQAVNNLVRAGKSVRVIGNVWVQGEQDSKNQTDANNYQRECGVVLDMFDKAVGCVIPTTFVKLRSNDSQDAGRFLFAAPINTAFDQLALARGNGSWVLDPYTYSGAVPAPTVNKSTQGTLYQADFVHYTTAAVGEFGKMIYDRVTGGYRGVLAMPPLMTPAMNYFDKQGTALTKATADYAKAAVNAAVSTSTISASNFVSSSSTNVVLPAITQIDAGTTAAQVLTATRDSTDKKKYFGFSNWISGGRFKFLQLAAMLSDTQFGGLIIRCKGALAFGALLRMTSNATPSNTFQSTGFNYVYVGIGHNSTDFAYTTAITAGTGAGTSSAAADGTSAAANTPKVVIYAFDSLAAAASYRVLSVSTINTTTHPNFVSAGPASEIEVQYALENIGANGTITVKYRAIGTTAWTTLYSYAIPASNTLGSELANGGQGGLAFGIGTRNTPALMNLVKVSAITPVVLE